jgi:hypothetical protein
LAQPVVPNGGLTVNNQIWCYRSWHTLTFGSGFERRYWVKALKRQNCLLSPAEIPTGNFRIASQTRYGLSQKTFARKTSLEIKHIKPEPK